MPSSHQGSLQCPCQTYRQGQYNTKFFANDIHITRSSHDVTSSSTAGNATIIFCKKCVHALLSHAISQHKSAAALCHEKRQECDRTLRHLRQPPASLLSEPIVVHDPSSSSVRVPHTATAPATVRNSHSGAGDIDQTSSVPISAHQTILEYQNRIETLNRDIERTRQACAKMSMALASHSVVQSNRSKIIQQQRQVIHELRSYLDTLHNCILLSPKDDLPHGHDSDSGNPSENSNCDDPKRLPLKNRNDESDLMVAPKFHSGIIKQGPVGLEGTVEYDILLVQKKRFQLALEAFEMHRMDVGSDYNQLTLDDLLLQHSESESDPSEQNQDDPLQPHAPPSKDVSAVGTEMMMGHDPPHTHSSSSSSSLSLHAMEWKRFQRLVKQRVPSGIGKIGGLLLPHRGPMHFHGVLPSSMLVSSLRLIASLTSLLARCLSIELPHPIVLCPMAPTLEREGGGHGVEYLHHRQQQLQQQALQRFVKSDELWLRDQTSDILALSSLLHHSAFDGDDDNDDLNGKGITLMKHVDDLDPGIATRDETKARHCTFSESTFTGEQVSVQKIKNHGPSHASFLVKQSTSASSLMSLVESSSKLISHSARRALDKMTGHHHHHQQQQQQQQQYGQGPKEEQSKSRPSTSVASVPMDKDSVALRVKFSSCAIIYECIPRENVSNSRYELRPPSATADREMQQKGEEQFAIGLQLLQNDIIALCIKAGVPISMLWPAEAMCLNLHSLRLYLAKSLGK